MRVGIREENGFILTIFDDTTNTVSTITTSTEAANLKEKIKTVSNKV